MDVGWWALIVSAGSLLLGLANYWRNRTLKPRWVRKVTINHDRDGGRLVTGSVVNRGRGVAHEVTFQPVADQLMQVLSRSARSEAGFGDALEVTLIYPADAEGEGAFTLSWREEPRLHKLRTKRLKYALKAEVQPDPRP